MSTPTAAELFLPIDDADPATPGDPFTRLHYRYGQLLGAEDFTAEQRYFLLRSRLHNAALHGYGTVWGLGIGHQEAETRLMLTCAPGLAVDALGREIHVPRSVCLDISGLASTRFWADLAPPPPTPPVAIEGDDDSEGGGEADAEADRRRRVYVVLRYRACLTEPAPAIAQPCAGADAGLAPSRVSDGYRLCLEATAPTLAGLPVRDVIAAVDAPHDARARLLAHILTAEPAPARLWSGADDAPLLLAVIDLEPVGDPAERVRLAGPIDNGVRALLPAVQAVADLALGIHLEGRDPTARFQAAAPGARAGAGADLGHMLIEVPTTRPVLAASLVPGSVRVMRFDAAAGQWVEPAILARSTSASGLALTVDEDWPAATPFQVWLAGSGPVALLDVDGHPLAGAVGEVVPAGSGRDAALFAIHPTTA